MVMCSEDADVGSDILKATSGEYAHAAVDPVGSTVTQLVANVTRPAGLVIIYGALGGRTLTVNIMDILLGKQLVV